MTERLFDSHAHLQDPAYAPDELKDVLGRAERAGVGGVIVCGYDGPSNVRAIELSQRTRWLFPAVGYHPHEASEVSSAMLEELESLAALDAVVAVGEIGLDFYRDFSPRAEQRKLLDRQLEIALRVSKPVSLHTRGAEGEIGGQLAPYALSVRSGGRANAGVLHCFGGTVEQARPLVEMGFLVSLACPITYPRNDEARRLARELPLGMLVVETDSPYLPPQPLRGRRNEPAQVVAAARAGATARGTSFEAVARATTQNAEQLFGVTLFEKVGTA